MDGSRHTGNSRKYVVKKNYIKAIADPGATALWTT